MNNSAIFRSLVINSVVFILTMLGNFVYASVSANTPEHFQMFAHILFWAGVAFLFVLLCSGTILEIGDTLRRFRRASREILETAKTVPDVVRFVERSDHLTVDAEGNGRFRLDYLIESNVDDAIHQLSFPVTFDVNDTSVEPGDLLSVERIEVNNQQIACSGRYKPRRVCTVLAGPAPKVVEYGVLSVPVNLSVGVLSCRVSVELVMKKAFTQLANEETIIVDVPYVTENLTVSIATSRPGGVCELLEGREPIDARSEMMELGDRNESTTRSNEIQAHGREILWKTKYPKLGYRYTLWFKVTERRPAGA